MHLHLAAALDARPPHDVGAGTAAVEVFGRVVSLFQSFYLLHVFIREADGAVAQPFAQLLPKRADAEWQIVLQQTDTAAHALHALLLEFAHVGVQGSLHQSRVGVVEHGAVRNGTAGLVVEGIAAHLSPSLQHDVVTAGNNRWSTKLSQGAADGLGIFLEKGFHHAVLGDEAGHDVPLVGKDGTAAAAPPDNVDAFPLAEVQVHLLVGHLIAPHHDGGPQLPGEEVAVEGQFLGDVLLGGQVEGGPAPLGVHGELHEAGREVWRGVVWCHVLKLSATNVALPFRMAKQTLIFSS